MKRLSVVWATKNEEANMGRSIKSVKNIADEMIVVDEYSSDKTAEVSKELGAKVILEPHHEIFHITKQKALEVATGEWVLQMDADEVITPELADDIQKVINGQVPSINPKLKPLFNRHQKAIEDRDGIIGENGSEIVAYFIPRVNMFLGRPLVHAGVYPDPAIRLIKKGRAHFPAKSVHEIMQINGKVSWLYTNMLHFDSPTFRRYLTRFNRYTDLFATEYKNQKLSTSIFTFINYTFVKPLVTFLSLYFRHKGFMDGSPGFLWSFFSASRFPISYFKYLTFKG